MKKAKFLSLVALILVAVFCLAACTVPDTTTPTEAPTEPTTPVEPSDPENPTKPENPSNPEESTPVIHINPAEVEINAGDEIDLMFGVTVTDEGDEDVRLIIEDDSDFDAETEGVYVITYKAINKFGKEATATRTITVNKALSAISVEVKANRLGENKWTGNIISFKNQLFVELSANTTLEALSGVFHNNTSSAIVLNIGGDYGVAAIIDANGVVIEGRDGANGRVVNAANPVRSSSTVNTIEINGEKVSVVENFAKNLVIPAGGYAIVVQNGYAGTTVDSDGRGFMNYNVIYQIGNVVRLFWADNNQDLTTYVDQAPEVSGNNNIVAALGDDGFNLESAVLAGIIAKDDNGTFAPTDDTNATVTITNNGGFNIGVAGKYTVTLTATDGKLTTTFTRVIEVVDNSIKVVLNNKSLTVAATKWIYNQEVTTNSAAKYTVIAYDKKYTGTFTTNEYGAALVLDQYGRLVKIYDGANLGFWTADGKASSTHFTTKNYATVAWEELQDGELLLICPNDGGSNISRGWALGHRAVSGAPGSMGCVASITGFTFPEAPHDCTSKCAKCGGCLDAECTEAVCATKCPGHAHECESKCATCGKCLDMACTEAVCAEKCACHECESKCNFCGKCTDKACEFSACAEKCSGHVGSMLLTIGTQKFEAVDGKWAINQEITTTTAEKKDIWVFTKAYTGSFATNGYGAALVLDQYGVLVRVYDGANIGYYVDNVKQASAHFNANTYATVAWSELKEGETLIICPNDGGAKLSRAFGLACRSLGGQKMSITGITFASKEMTISIGAKTYTATEGKWAINQEITTTTAANKAIWIFTKEYTGNFTTNGWGVAVVLDSYGKVTRVYVGAYSEYWANGAKQEKAHFDANTYATVAWSELQEGETLVVLPNGGSEGNAARQIGLDCRYLLGQKMSITGITFAN